MSGLYVYAITDTRQRATLTGIFGRQLRTIGVGGVHAVVEQAARAPKPTVARLRAQDRVLEALAASGRAVLPVRFGSFARGARDLRGMLEGRSPELTRALRQARGCAQMTIRMAFAPSTPRARGADSTGPRNGADYLRSLLAEDKARRRHPAYQALQRAARGLTRAERVEWHSGAVRAASIYHLVPRARLPMYLGKVARVGRRTDTTLVVSGPFLPFAFAGELR